MRDRKSDVCARKDNPRRTEIVFKASEICWQKILPAIQRCNFVQPARGQTRNASGHAPIFFIVSESAALRQSAEAVSILARKRFVVGIKREECIRWSIGANPGKGS